MNKINDRSKPSITEAFVKKHWTLVYNRGLRMLHVPPVARDVAVMTFAELGILDDDQSQAIKELYRTSTKFFLEKISGDKRRNTDWLRTLESQKSESSENKEKEQERQNLLDLLQMSQQDTKPFVLYRFLEGLDISSTAALCDISEEDAKARQQKFLELANEFLQGKGLNPISAPIERDCPDSFVMDRILAGEKLGLGNTQAHIEQHKQCSKKLQELKTERQDQPKDLPQVMDEIQLASKRLLEEKDIRSHDRSKKNLLIPALVAALTSGLLLWALFPSDNSSKGDPASYLGYRLMLLEEGRGTQKEIKSGTSIAPGDRLGIMLSSPKPMFVRILSLDDKGRPKNIMPPSVFSWPVNTTDPQKLPFSYKTDEKPGVERLFALFCPQEGMLKYLEQGLEFAYPRGVDGLRNLNRDLQSAPPHCEIKSVLVHREIAREVENKK